VVDARGVVECGASPKVGCEEIRRPRPWLSSHPAAMLSGHPLVHPPACVQTLAQSEVRGEIRCPGTGREGYP